MRSRHANVVELRHHAETEATVDVWTESAKRAEGVARLLQSHDMIQQYEPELEGIVVISEGWPGYINIWDNGNYEMLAAMSVLRIRVPRSPELLEHINDLNLLAISYQVALGYPNQAGVTSVVIRANVPTAGLRDGSSTLEWTVLSVYSVLHMGDLLAEGLERFGGTPPSIEDAAQLGFSLP
jgi:hypothetical protein